MVAVLALMDFIVQLVLKQEFFKMEIVFACKVFQIKLIVIFVKVIIKKLIFFLLITNFFFYF